MLPFSDIDFFLFAAIYIAVIYITGVVSGKKYYTQITFVFTLFYLLFYFKYSSVALSFVAITFLFIRFVSLKTNHQLINVLLIALPMILFKLHFNPSLFYFAGLSFVTFRTIQVCLEYKKEEPLNFVDYFNFLFFLPALYIGPLDRYKRFTNNCYSAYDTMQTELPLKGCQEVAKGIFYKFIVAEFISRYWLAASTGDILTAGARINDIYAYTFFLFFDFAGYSAMAVGMANMVGIDLPFNFNRPFISKNPAEFWQRWHASLTSWLTDYFFKPFYKWLSQRKQLKKSALTRQNIAIFFTFFLMGIWNGFEPNFVWSGIIYGIYSTLHNTYLVWCRKQDRDVVFGTLNPRWVSYISIFIMFHLACLALYVFSGRYQS